MKRRAIALAAVAALSLAACSSDEAANDTPAASEVEAGTTMPTVDVDGANTKLKFPDSGAPADLQVEVVEQGEGRVVEETDYVIANYVGQVWGNDDPFDSSFINGSPIGFSLQQVIEGWTSGLSGQNVGSKVILSIPADLGYGPSGGNTAAGIGAEDTIAFYVEIVDAFGMNQAGDPEATAEADLAEYPVSIDGAIGEPVTVTVEEGAAEPTDLQTVAIARGTGEKVADTNSSVFVQYAMSTWDNSAAETTYGTTGAYQAPLGMGSLFDELVGYEIGSRVLMLVPSDESGAAYAVVFDILGVQ